MIVGRSKKTHGLMDRLIATGCSRRRRVDVLRERGGASALRTSRRGARRHAGQVRADARRPLHDVDVRRRRLFGGRGAPAGRPLLGTTTLRRQRGVAGRRAPSAVSARLPQLPRTRAQMRRRYAQRLSVEID